MGQNFNRILIVCFLALFLGIFSNSNAQAPLKRPTVAAPSKETKRHNPRPAKLTLSVSGSMMGHGYVDMGLSVKWATCNVGADVPEASGDYFAWGEVKSKSVYTVENSLTSGKDIEKISELAGNDVAHDVWGDGWRLPTQTEVQELVENSTAKWTTYKGVKGYMLKSKKNGNRIFLAAAGLHDDTSSVEVGSYGGYWSASSYGKSGSFAYGLFFDSKDIYWGWDDRAYGHSIRPVCGK